MKKRITGFTLAEILITLSIIGVIASMTIPSLVQDINDAQFKTAWKSAYGTATQAWLSARSKHPSTYTGSSGWGSCGSPVDGRWNAFKSEFNVIKECNNQSGCWSANAESATGSVYLANTTTTGFVSNNGMYWTSNWPGVDEGHVSVDLNGEKGPNKWGIDMFAMLLEPDRLVPSLGSDKCARSTEPFTINGRQVYFSKPLYQ